MRYMLDTNVCMYESRDHSRALLRRLRGFRTAAIGASAVPVAELQYGVSKSEHWERS